MPKYTSPYGSSFKSAIKRGTPCFQAVQNIAKNNNKNCNIVFESLFKAGLCYRQKFNGQWIYWACEPGKVNATNKKYCQTNMWQWFVDWCICNGFCTPEKMNGFTSQAEFMSFCKKFFGKQFNGTTVGKTKKRPARKSAKSRTTASRKRPTARKTTGRRTTRAKSRSTSASYRFTRKSTGSRRYRRAA